LKYLLKIPTLFILVFLAHTLLAKDFNSYNDGDSVKVKKERIFEVFNTYGLNSEYSEISPIFYNKELVFCSNREWNKNTFGESDWHQTKHYNIFRSSINFNSIDSVGFEKIKVFNHFLVTHLNVGPISFNREYTEAVYVENEYLNKKNRVDKSLHVQLYSLKIENGKIKDKEKLNFCKSKFNYSHPSLSSDGKLLVFTSNMPCKHKGLNLFYSLKGDGIWSDPQPLSSLNSDANEIFPVIHRSDLYFSSDGYDTKGGYDLFVSHKIDSLEDISKQYSNHFNLGEVINSEKDDFSIAFNPNGSSGYFVSNRADTSLSAELNDDIYSFEIIDKAIFNKDFKNIAGKFEYFRLNGSPKNMEVMLLDEDGNVFAITTTDDHGNFNFDYIPSGKKYTIKLNEDGEVVLTLFEGNENTLLLSNDKGEFIFRKLSLDKVGTMSLIDEGDVDFELGTYNFRGQLEFQKISDSSFKKTVVYLVDENGNVVMETLTDEFGNFVFEKLPYGSNYMVKVEQEDDLILRIYNDVDHIMATLTKDPNGNFIYRLLDYEHTTNISLLSEDFEDLSFSEERMLISGVFKSLNGIYEKIPFEVLDREGNLLLYSETDKNGKFKLENLPLLEDLIFKINEDSPFFKEDLQISIVSRGEEILITLDKDEYGMFEFKRLVSSKYHTTSTSELEEDDFALADEVRELRIENFVVYYPVNIYQIDKKYMSNLDTMLITLNEFPASKLQIHAHASSTSTESYNMKLSIKRMNTLINFFESRGISKERMTYKAYGESKLLNSCGDDRECEDEMHQINRRSELRIISKN
jgi:outer membrane protein OmpA-like peptidoglycan-associated protein